MTQQEKENRLNAINSEVLTKEAELNRTNQEIVAALETLFSTGDLAFTMQTAEGIAARQAADQRIDLRMQIDRLRKDAAMLEAANVTEDAESRNMEE